MAKVLDTLTGQVVDVPDDVAAPQVVKSPRYQDVTGGRVEVVEQSGRRGTVPLEDLQKAHAAGMTFLPGGVVEEERLQEKYGGQVVKANAEALARGLTVGISDEVLTETGLVEKEALRERQARTPGTTVSELGGAILPALIPGVGEATISGQVARLGTAASKMATTAVGKAAVAGAVEGGLFGLGGLLTEHSMGNTDITAEKAVAAFGTGAFLGAGTGYALAKGGQKLSKLLGRTDDAAAAAATADDVVDDALALAGDDAAVAAEGAGGAAKGKPTGPQSTRVDWEEVGAKGAGEAAAGRPRAALPGGAPEPGGPEIGSTPGAKKAPAEPEDAADAAGAVFGNANAVKERVQKMATENPGFFRKLFETFDLPFPDADNFVLRGLDAKKAQLKKLRTSGLLKDAPGALRADPRFKGIPGDERWANGVKTGEDAAELVKLKLSEEGERYRNALEKLDASRLPEEGIDGYELARRIQRNVLEPLSSGPAAAKPTADVVEAEIQKLLGMADEQGKLSLRAMEDVKRSFDPWAQFNRSTPPAEASRAMAFRDMREQVKKAVEEHADSISKRIGGGDALQFRAAKRNMQRMYALDEIAKDRLEDAKTANRVFSLTDNIGGFAAGVLGGGLTPTGIAAGLGVALLNKWGRENLPWVLAKSLTRFDESAGARAAVKGLRQLIEKTDEEANALARTGTPPPVEGGPGSALARREESGLAVAEPGRGGALTMVDNPGAALTRVDDPAAGALTRVDDAGMGAATSVDTPSSAAVTRAERRLPLLGKEPLALPPGSPAESAVPPVPPGVAPLPNSTPDASHPFGKWAETLRRAAALGERELWLTHVLLSKDEEYRSSLQALGGTDFTAEGDRRALRRNTAFQALDGVTRRLDNRIDAAVGGFLKGAKAKPMQLRSSEESSKKAESVLKLSTSPEAFTAAVARELGGLPEHAPQTAEGMSAVLTRAVQFLASKAPRGPSQPQDIPALRKPFRPPATEVSRFSRYLAAVEDPAGVLDDMAAGMVTREAVEALQTVYPTLWSEVQGKLMERLGSTGTSLDYKQRLALAQVLGPETVDVAGGPAAVKMLQSTFSGPGADELGAPRSNPRPPADGRVGKRILAEQSPGDRAASR